MNSRSNGGACAGRLVLFDNVLDVVTRVHVFCICWTGLHHILRRGATCVTCNITFIFNQMLTLWRSCNHVLSACIIWHRLLNLVCPIPDKTAKVNFAPRRSTYLFLVELQQDRTVIVQSLWSAGRRVSVNSRAHMHVFALHGYELLLTGLWTWRRRKGGELGAGDIGGNEESICCWIAIACMVICWACNTEATSFSDGRGLPVTASWFTS